MYVTSPLWWHPAHLEYTKIAKRAAGRGSNVFYFFILANVLRRPIIDTSIIDPGSISSESMMVMVGRLRTLASIKT